MFDRTAVIRLVEDALDRRPYCPACGRATTIHDEAGSLFLECPAVHPGEGLRSRLTAAIMGHLHESLVDLELPQAA